MERQAYVYMSVTASELQEGDYISVTSNISDILPIQVYQVDSNGDVSVKLSGQPLIRLETSEKVLIRKPMGALSTEVI